MTFQLAFKKFVKARFFVGLLIVGLIFLIAGCVMVSLPNRYTVTTTATITKIEQEYNSAAEDYDYTVYLTYRDADGNTYQETMGSYSSSWHEGSEIEIKYDPSDPKSFSYGNSSLTAYIALAVGAVACVASVVKFVIIMKTPSEEMNDMNRVDMNRVSQEQVSAIADKQEEKKEYHFYYTQGFKQSYIMETADGKHVFEALNQKVSVLTKYQFKFVNCLTGHEEDKECSHTVTTSYGNGQTSVDTDSSFKINGVNCWDVLGKAGYSVEPRLDGIHAIFDVNHYGVKVAEFERTGTNVATKKDYKLGNVPAPGIYRISCGESEIEGVFLCCFVVARTFDL